MTDQLLLIIGCVVGFVAFSGIYVGVRSGFAPGFSPAEDVVNPSGPSPSAEG